MTIVVSPVTSSGTTFGELLTEFYARGFDYLNQDDAGRTRAKRWLNEAMIEDVSDAQPWPWLETTITGTSPLTVSDLKDVLFVTDTTNGRRLSSMDSRDIADLDSTGSLTTTGTPDGYYLDGLETVSVYPVSAVELSVRYIRVPDLLSADSDVATVPDRFRPLIVDGAVIRALRDSDNWEAVQVAQQAFDQRLARMADSMFSRNFDNSQYVGRVMDHDG